MTPETLAHRLRKLRLEAGLPVKTAAKAAGVSVTSWNKWERGDAAYRPWRTPEIAAALGCPIGALFRDHVLCDLVLSDETLEEVRDGGREASRAVADRLARRLETEIYNAATRRPVDVGPGARPKPRRTREQVLAGIADAKTAREAARKQRRELAEIA